MMSKDTQDNDNTTQDNDNTTQKTVHDDTIPKSVHQSEPQNDRCKKINDIKAFTEVNDCDFSDVFVANQEFIFQYNKINVLEMLECREIKVLDSLRSKLAETLQSNFPGLSTKVLCNRRAKNTYSNDIFLLGLSIVNNALNIDVEKIFIAKAASMIPDPQDDETTENELTSLPELISCITSLKRTIIRLENELKATNQKFDILSDSITRMNAVKDPEAPTPAAEPPTQDQANPPEGNEGEAEADSGRSTEVICISSTSESDSSADSEQDEYQVQRLEKKSKRRKKQRAQQKNSTPGLLAASSSQTALVTPPAKDNAANVKELYLGNVHTDTSVHTVCSHLSSLNINVQPSDVKQLSQTKQSKSYKISIPTVHYEKVLSKERPVWPKGVKVRPFYPKNQNRSQPGSSGLRGAGINTRRRDPGSGRHYRPASKPSNRQERRQPAYDHTDDEWPRLPQTYHSRRYDDTMWQEDNTREHDAWYNSWYAEDWNRY